MTAVQISQDSKKQSTLWLVAMTAALLTACAVPEPSARKAPIVEYGTGDKRPTSVATPAAPKKPVTPITETISKTYVVQKGDTLYSIAFFNGVDYREVAELNNLKNPAAIKIGQQLRLKVPVAQPVAKAEQEVKAEPKPEALQHPALPVPLGGIKNQPKVGRLAYSEQALANADRMQEDAPQIAPVVVAEKSQPANMVKDEGVEEALEWGMPTSGKVIADYSESANRKGVDIVGKRGQAIVASASGKVVYSGSGLRGYGKLIIIKHNKTFLSAYAHNDQIMVKEGQNVSKGQKIAEMGNSDADQVKLHFEIRKLGKPVDPAKFLPLVKS